MVKVSTAPLLVSRNASYGWPAVAPGTTHTPLISVPPLVSGEHSRVMGRDWASAGVAAAMAASSNPAAAMAATVLLIMSFPHWYEWRVAGTPAAGSAARDSAARDSGGQGLRRSAHGLG